MQKNVPHYNTKAWTLLGALLTKETEAQGLGF